MQLKLVCSLTSHNHLISASALPVKTQRHGNSIFSLQMRYYWFATVQPVAVWLLQSHWLSTYTHAAVRLSKSCYQRSSALGCWDHMSGWKKSSFALQQLDCVACSHDTLNRWCAERQNSHRRPTPWKISWTLSVWVGRLDDARAPFFVLFGASFCDWRMVQLLPGDNFNVYCVYVCKTAKQHTAFQWKDAIPVFCAR